MTMVTLVGEFQINGQSATAMEVDSGKAIRFNEISGIVAVVGTGRDGKVVKGLAYADELVLQQIQRLGSNANRDESIRMPEAF